MESVAASRSRPNSGKRRQSKSSTAKKVRSQTGLTENPHTPLASRHEADSKSAAGFSKVDEKNKPSTKQAWAAPPKNNSSRSPYGHSEPSMPKSEPIFSKSKTSLFKATDGSTFLMVNNELSSSENFGRRAIDDDFGRVSEVCVSVCC